jgi:hypothetical protein
MKKSVGVEFRSLSREKKEKKSIRCLSLRFYCLSLQSSAFGITGFIPFSSKSTWIAKGGRESGLERFRNSTTSNKKNRASSPSSIDLG